MGYLDASTTHHFTTTRDGRRLFIPGLFQWGRGYVIGSEQDFERLRHRLKTYQAGAFVFILVAVWQMSLTAGLVVAALVFVAYSLLAGHLTRGMQPMQLSEAGLESFSPKGYFISPKGHLAVQARALGGANLWFLLLGSLVFVAGGIFLFSANPAKRDVAVEGMVFFGFCAALFAYQFWLRNRKTRT
jgi:hypothetical protein